MNGASYCWNPIPVAGGIADFSSQGPRRDGVLKPDLTAPGLVVVSTLSKDATFPQFTLAPDGEHVAEAGTSQAAPHVTGACAILLSQPGWHNAYPSQVRADLEATARSDVQTGILPNTIWGHGKLDIASALNGAIPQNTSSPSSGLDLVTVYPNPSLASTRFLYALPVTERVTLRVFDVQGHLVATVLDQVEQAGLHSALWNGHDGSGRRVAAGIHFVRLEAGGQVKIRKVLIVH